MGFSRDTIVSLMRSWVGKNEKDGSHREIIDIYNTISPLPRGYKVKYTDAWCATTVSAAFHQVGYDSIFPLECGCPDMIDKAKKMGIWQESDSYVPQPGDCILYDWQDTGTGDNTGTPDHVGMVETVSNNLITVIEGNYNDAVKRRQIAVNGKFIRGYVCPKFDTGTTTKKSKGLNTTPLFVGKVTAHALNVRRWAGTNYPKLSSYPVLYENNLVDVCDVVTASGGDSWYYIRIAGKVYGFVHSKWIKGV